VRRSIGLKLLIIFLHSFPDLIRNGDAVSVEVESVRGDNVSLSSEADGGGDRLTREHVSAVELASDDVVEKLFPVGLSDDFDREAFCFEEALFLRNDDGGAVS